MTHSLIPLRKLTLHLSRPSFANSKPSLRQPSFQVFSCGRYLGSVLGFCWNGLENLHRRKPQEYRRNTLGLQGPRDPQEQGGYFSGSPIIEVPCHHNLLTVLAEGPQWPPNKSITLFCASMYPVPLLASTPHKHKYKDSMLGGLLAPKKIL